ncbi:MAG TPA: hypothetical protein PLJ99_01265 [Kiritimatiellia bacterium]|nr:hypothetical protein [Kiritimatiellia bacterium]
MRKLLCLLCLAWTAQAALADPGADLPPVFSPQPPDPAAASLVESYLSLLAQGDLPGALALHDLRGMRQYLLDRRLDDLKTNNPGLTAEDLEELSAQIQVHDLDPARLRAILMQVLEEADYPGMTWSIRGYAPAPDDIPGYLVRIEGRSAAGREKPLLVGLVKLGDDWLISPAVVEELMSRRPVLRVGPTVAPPPEVNALVDRFWQSFQSGEPDQAYAGMSAEFRARTPLLAFLSRAQTFLEKAGLPSRWSFVRAIETQPGLLFVGVQVQGSKAPQATLMVFRKTGLTWIIEDVQFDMPRPGVPAAPGATPPNPLSRPDLRPDLTPDLSPAPIDRTPAVPASDPPPPPSGPAVPDAPEGPVAN